MREKATNSRAARAAAAAEYFKLRSGFSLRYFPHAVLLQYSAALRLRWVRVRMAPGPDWCKLAKWNRKCGGARGSFVADTRHISCCAFPWQRRRAGNLSWFRTAVENCRRWLLLLSCRNGVDGPFQEFAFACWHCWIGLEFRLRDANCKVKAKKQVTQMKSEMLPWDHRPLALESSCVQWLFYSMRLSGPLFRTATAHLIQKQSDATRFERIGPWNCLLYMLCSFMPCKSFIYHDKHV